jgi:hypothetical protein
MTEENGTGVSFEFNGLVVAGASELFNPTLDPKMLAAARAADPNHRTPSPRPASAIAVT